VDFSAENEEALSSARTAEREAEVISSSSHQGERVLRDRDNVSTEAVAIF
jgi:hypothetical protein